MKVSIGFDHGALPLRAPLLQHLKDRGIEFIDHGTSSNDSVDYPDYASKVALDVSEGRAETGILCCTTGIGMSLAANKFRNIRAAVIHYEDEAALTRQHNHSNVICMGALHTTPYEANRLVDIFLDTPFEKGGRHERRVGKINQLESNC